MKKQKNRFLPGAHVSESILARALFCWLNGELYSAIPEAIQQKGGAVDAAMNYLHGILGENFTLTENAKASVSRQACHSIIAEISLQVIVRSYKDRVASFEEVIRGDDPIFAAERRRMVSLVGHEPSEVECAALVESMKGQGVQDYIIRWGKIVLILSANAVPYDAMRAIPGVKPFDVIQNPVILGKMQERYRSFRGYKVTALKTHIAHYFLLRNGADYLRRTDDSPVANQLHMATDVQKSAYWTKCVIYGLACLLLQLETGMTYHQLRQRLLSS